MSLKYGFLSFLLLCAALSLAMKNYEVWVRPVAPIDENQTTARRNDKPKQVVISEKDSDTTHGTSYVSLAQRNIFSPERKEFSASAAPVEESKSFVRPEIILYGVVITSEFQSASVVNRGSPLRQGEREMKTIRLGDSLGAYKLARILPDRIMMETQAGDSFDVLLHDPKVQKKKPENPKVKTAHASQEATAAEIQNPAAQGMIDKSGETVPSTITRSRAHVRPEDIFPNRELAIKSRAALISPPSASKK